MSKTLRVWNLTPKRFETIVSKELEAELRESFTKLFGNSYGQIENNLENTFNCRKWMKQDDKISALSVMIKIFRIMSTEDQSQTSVYSLFAQAVFLRLPGCFEIFERSPESFKNCRDIYMFKNGRTPHASYAYLKLLEKVGFDEAFIFLSRETVDPYVERVTSHDRGTYTKNQSDYVDLISADRDYLDGFGVLKVPLMMLMIKTYGEETFESALSAFVDSQFCVSPDDLITVMDRWDEFSTYPGVWTAEVLGLKDARTKSSSWLW